MSHPLWSKGPILGSCLCLGQLEISAAGVELVAHSGLRGILLHGVTGANLIAVCLAL